MRLARLGTRFRRIRFPGVMLRRSNSLLALSVAIFVAGVAGVQLGQSAVGAINPLYFEGEPLKPVAVDGRERQPAQPAYYRAFNWEQGAEARAIACGDNCGRPEPYDTHVYRDEPQFAAGSWRERAPAMELEPWAPGEVSSERRPALMRYADYPIEAKPETDEEEPDGAADIYEE